MKTELQFLEYMERQICIAGEMIYTAWLKQEISFRKSELENNQSPNKSEMVSDDNLSLPVSEQVQTGSDTHSELNKEILSDYTKDKCDVCGDETGSCQHNAY